jgi:hypothetical protein
LNSLSDSEDISINISPVEWCLIIAFILGGCLFGYRFATGPKYWDDLLYLHTAWSMEARPFILNRYLSIYLLGFFNIIAKGDPLLGGQYFGAFTFSAIISLVYINARILAKRFGFFFGLLAVLFLLSLDDFTKGFGVVLADYTVTMMMLMGVLIFLLIRRFKHHRKFLLILFGLILFLSIKSKETGITLCLLIPSFFIDSGKQSTKKDILGQLSLILMGGLIGIILFMILNGIFLGDAFFGLRTTDFRTLIEFNTNQDLFPQDINNNYLYFVSPNIAFLLSLVWIIQSEDYFKSGIRWLWFLVLGIIIFLDLTLINGGWQLIPRYLTPAYAILSITAAQILQLDYPHPEQGKIKYLPYIIIGSLLISGTITIPLSHLIAKHAGWGFDFFAIGILSPIIFCLLLFQLCFRRKNSIFSLILMATCIGALILPRATYNMFLVLSGQTKQESRFLPFIEFKDVVTCEPDKRIFISGTFLQNDRMLSRDSSSSQWMYDLYFRCHTPEKHFYYGNSQEEIYNNLLMNTYDYVFLHGSDYYYIEDQVTQGQEILNRYLVLHGESSVLLIKN